MYFVFIYFIRCNDIAKRKIYVELVDSVRDNGGEVKMFSSLHTSGERKLVDVHFMIGLFCL